MIRLNPYIIDFMIDHVTITDIINITILLFSQNNMIIYQKVVLI